MRPGERRPRGGGGRAGLTGAESGGGDSEGTGTACGRSATSGGEPVAQRTSRGEKPGERRRSRLGETTGQIPFAASMGRSGGSQWRASGGGQPSGRVGRSHTAAAARPAGGPSQVSTIMEYGDVQDSTMPSRPAGSSTSNGGWASAGRRSPRGQRWRRARQLGHESSNRPRVEHLPGRGEWEKDRWAGGGRRASRVGLQRATDSRRAGRGQTERARGLRSTGCVRAPSARRASFGEVASGRHWSAGRRASGTREAAEPWRAEVS